MKIFNNIKLIKKELSRKEPNIRFIVRKINEVELMIKKIILKGNIK